MIRDQDFVAAEVELIRGFRLGLDPSQAVSQEMVQESFSGRDARRRFGAIPRDDIIIPDGTQLKRLTIDGNQVLTDDPECLRM